MSINLSVLKYIVALDNYKNFVKAAQACNVTQPSLSTAIQKLENDLDITIFDRSSHPIKTTILGEKILVLARKALADVSQIEEFVMAERGKEIGELSVGILPTIAPYLLPDFFRKMAERHSGISLSVEELRTELAIRKLENAELDVAIMATPLSKDNLLEIPLYYENFLVYVSEKDELYSLKEIPVEALATDRIWIMAEGHCIRNQVMNFCHLKDNNQIKYQAGSIATLIDIVDNNGGYTIIPQLHAAKLCEERQKNIRTIVGHKEGCARCVPNREISLVIRRDFIKERLLNILAEVIKSIIPDYMLDERLKQFSIKI